MKALNKFMMAVDKTNLFIGKVNVFLVLLAVAVITFEVTARYLFHRPTNWGHELMTYLFGIVYIMSGGYAHYHRTHVRVDVIYASRSRKTRAAMDLITSVLFFLVVGVMLYTFWSFYWSSQNMLGGGTVLGMEMPGELSLTDWAPPFYPIKFVMPLGAFMLLLQGIVWFIRDLRTVMES